MTRPWGMQPDESYPLGLIRQVADGVERLDHLVRGNGGEGILTRLSHLERTDKEMQVELERLRNSLDMLQRPGTAVQEAKWRAWAEIGVAIGVVASLVLHLLKLTGVTP